MRWSKLAEPDLSRDRSAVIIQPDVYPLPSLRKPWFSKQIVCDEGWSLSFSGSSWRIDRYDYFEGNHHLILGGEGALGQMDIVIEATLFWDEPAREPLDEPTRARVLRNITAALQWAGYSVGFFEDCSGSR